MCPDLFLIFRNGVEHETNIVQISYNKTCNDEYTSNAILVPGLSSGTSESGSVEASPAPWTCNLLAERYGSADFVITGLIHLETRACFSVRSGIRLGGGTGFFSTHKPTARAARVACPGNLAALHETATVEEGRRKDWSGCNNRALSRPQPMRARQRCLSL